LVHRLVMAFHLVGVAVGAGGMRLACRCRTLSALDRFVAASSGAPHQVTRPGEAALDVCGDFGIGGTAACASAFTSTSIKWPIP
jgi:hypothetical protein